MHVYKITTIINFLVSMKKSIRVEKLESMYHIEWKYFSETLPVSHGTRRRSLFFSETREPFKDHPSP